MVALDFLKGNVISGTKYQTRTKNRFTQKKQKNLTENLQSYLPVIS